ncbi:DNA repair protein RAD51 homolog 2-like isoform X1 [Ascaphus truei]|uniref:DNA repair protein RAD51 homolog 2-like isoform X1 n=1 Tax=Ascaphus truei TaxID=8439 RepID=UPI003F5AB1AB
MEVILTNQITTRLRRGYPPVADPVSPDDDLSVSEASEVGDRECVTPALGNTWTHSVNTRLIIEYLDSQRRQIIVAKSPVAPFAGFVYTIQAAGLVLQGQVLQDTPPSGRRRKVGAQLWTVKKEEKTARECPIKRKYLMNQGIRRIGSSRLNQ